MAYRWLLLSFSVYHLSLLYLLSFQDLAEKLSDQALGFGFNKPILSTVNEYLPKLEGLQPGNDVLVIIVAATYTGLPANTANQVRNREESI